MPQADDTIKCELQPLRRADYAPAVFTDAQWAALRRRSPTACATTRSRASTAEPTVPWQTYQDAAGKVVYGGRPLGAVPAQKVLGW